MSVFTPEEIEYITGQKLGRLATVSPKGQPQNAPVGFRYIPELDMIEIGGRYMSRSKKFRNIQQNPHVSLVIDDILPPWTPRAVEIRGTAEALPTGGKNFFGSDYDADDGLIRIKATQIISWGLDGNAYKQNNRKVS